MRRSAIRLIVTTGLILAAGCGEQPPAAPAPAPAPGAEGSAGAATGKGAVPKRGDVAAPGPSNMMPKD
jgi:hypothetical protein